MPREESLVYSALLKHWRKRRGYSQLDLALAADVSARHISFLETGRARPSREMVLRLGAALQVPLREQDEMLDACGLPLQFEAPPFENGLPHSITRAIERMLAQHEPYPMLVMDRAYDALMLNRGAERLLTKFLAQPQALTSPANVFRVLFDPRLARPFIVEWERLARTLLSRLHREALARPGDHVLAQLVDELFAYPDVPAAWRQPDFSTPSEPVLNLTVQRDELRLSFLTTMTVFNAPQNVTLEDLRIESYFPADDATAAAIQRL